MAEEEDYIQKALFRMPGPHCDDAALKVSVVGCGAVGSAVAYALCIKNVCTELALFDTDARRLEAELLDLSHASALLATYVYGDSDPAVTAGSELVVVAAGRRGEEGEPPLLGNMALFCDLIPELARLSPRAVFVVVTDPVEVMTFAAVAFGDLPVERVVGLGTALETARLRSAVAARLGVHPASVQACVYGVHRDCPVVDWAGVTVGGVPFLDMDPSTQQRLQDDPAFSPAALADSSKEIVEKKGCISWSAALGVVELCSAVLRNTMQILPVTTHVEVKLGEESLHTFLSLPCVVGGRGVLATANLQTSAESRQQFFRAARRANFIQEHARQSFFRTAATASPQPSTP
ncbi:L-lactate dehydrogenase A chain-like [Bacillus rossius redtenbacheri]|uniref:L-lactate dehydrogenase A chain-like n=1 Tax=Bacillus rossius redtenbacheri TaxID=93214 RepID=UPI002FDDEA1B